MGTLPILLFCLYFAQKASSTTEYVNDNVSVVLQSVQPCAIIGDPDLYGQGVRYAFYIQFTTGILASFFVMDDVLKTVRRGFILLILPILIVLWRAADHGSFAIFEWWITSSLLFLSISTIPPWLGDGKLTVDKREDGQDPESQQWLKECNVPYLDDPIGIGVFYLLLAAWGFSQCWLFWTQAEAGHKATCVVYVQFFDAINLYGGAFQGFLKAFSIIVIFASFYPAFQGLRWLFTGAIFWLPIETAADRVRDSRKSRIANGLKISQMLKGARGVRGYDKFRSQYLPYLKAITDDESRMYTEYKTGRATEAQFLAVQEKVRHLQKLFARSRDTSVQQRQDRSMRWQRRPQILIWLIIGILLIVFVEDTLRLNDLQIGSSFLSSTGQTLSFLVAVFTAITFLWQVFKWYNKKDRELISTHFIEAGTSLREHLVKMAGLRAAAQDQQEDDETNTDIRSGTASAATRSNWDNLL